MTIQEKPKKQIPSEKQIEVIRSCTDQKERKKTGQAILALAEINYKNVSDEVVYNKATVSVADYGDYVFISSQMFLRKEGE